MLTSIGVRAVLVQRKLQEKVKLSYKIQKKSKVKNLHYESELYFLFLDFYVYFLVLRISI